MEKFTIKSIEKCLDSEPFLSSIAPTLMRLPIGSIKKNILLCKIEARKGTQVVKSMPYRGVLNITNACNLRCNFCEITYFHQKFKKAYPNNVDMSVLQKYAPWLRNLYALDFYGSVGEPTLNKNFTKIVSSLKSQYSTRLFINTNGTMLYPDISPAILSNVDDVLISVHAGTRETYAKLVGDGFERVVANIRHLVTAREISLKQKPKIGLAFALNIINATDIESFVNLAQELGVDYVAVSHYYHVRNKFGALDISYNSHPLDGNAFINWLYLLAKQKGIAVQPEHPPYLPQHPSKKQCIAPWSTIKFEGCMEYENSHYIAVCNRIVLFRLDYSEYDFSSGVNAIQNHPVLQYMRGTVNSECTNEICAFCKDESTPQLRCINNEEYRHRRDGATKEFFKHAREHFDMPEIKGLYLLEETPYE